MTDDMLTVADIARLTGLTEGTVYTYRVRGDLPAETGMLGNRPWWSREVIERWWAERKQPGRPSSSGD